MKIRLDFIGCRLNISEIESLSRQFRMAGHVVVGPGEVADLCVFNSCAVTGNAARRSRQQIRRLKNDNPAAGVIVTGCYAELEPEVVTALDVDLVVGNEDKDRLVSLAIEAGLLHHEGTVPDPDATFPLPEAQGGHTRAFVKVQDGCDNRCTFCIVTVARGGGRSRSIQAVLDEVNELHRLGYQEAVLTGVHLGSFGHDLGQPRGLFHLVRAILAETDIPRLRLSSLEPWDLDDTFFELWDNPRLCRHLHLPLQSGSDAVLRRMARRTTQADFARLVTIARQAIPQLAVSSDMIVGFPGETDAEFEDSFNFVQQMNFSRLHIFRYSPRAGTAAAAMPHHLPGDVAAERSRRLHALAADHERAFRRLLLGQTFEVLWETSEPTVGGHLWYGLTDNYVRVAAFSTRNRYNQISVAQLKHLLPDAISGDIPGESIPLQVMLPV